MYDNYRSSKITIIGLIHETYFDLEDHYNSICYIYKQTSSLGNMFLIQNSLAGCNQNDRNNSVGCINTTVFAIGCFQSRSSISYTCGPTMHEEYVGNFGQRFILDGF